MGPRFTVPGHNPLISTAGAAGFRRASATVVPPMTAIAPKIIAMRRRVRRRATSFPRGTSITPFLMHLARHLGGFAKCPKNKEKERSLARGHCPLLGNPVQLRNAYGGALGMGITSELGYGTPNFPSFLARRACAAHLVRRNGPHRHPP